MLPIIGNLLQMIGRKEIEFESNIVMDPLKCILKITIDCNYK